MAFPVEGHVHRSTVTGTRGMVASGHPLATLAGTRMLLQGGNAFDAIVATAAALNVVEPYMSGMAGVGYALAYSAKEKSLRVLDYCGRTPHAATPDLYPTPDLQEGGILSPLVPGAIGGWLTLLETHGTMDRATVFAPAIELAGQGFAFTVKNHIHTDGAVPRLRPTGMEIIAPTGKAPKPGDVLVQDKLARTFKRIVEGGRDVFYTGDLAKEMIAFIEAEGGILSHQDLQDFSPEWVDPVTTRYHGFDVYAPPPPSAGFQILQTLNMLENDDLVGMGHLAEETLHLLIESLKLSNADRVAYAAADPAPIAGLLSKGYAATRRSLVGDTAAVTGGEYFPAAPVSGAASAGTEADWINECTTHFDAVDAEGNAVAITQSLGSGYGSGVAIGETGMFINNFIKWADTVPGSPNCIEPHKKIDQCLSPCQIWRDGHLVSALGTPGSWGIQQTTTQFMTNYLDYGMNIQGAIEAPRFRFGEPGKQIRIESRVSPEVRAGLTARGHELDVLPTFSPIVGGAQGITVDPESGAFMGGADPRRDGYVIGI
jgi:gamma-glutamyltranspeptidase / glutathione hydrolase